MVRLRRILSYTAARRDSFLPTYIEDMRIAQETLERAMPKRV
ncbi:MAG TPA: hypothetical protein VK003_08680 [Oceanobacillus sp.]|nr:hypothetical protein [Oceanobacillus sp.]